MSGICGYWTAWPGLPSLALQPVAVDGAFSVGGLTIKTVALPHGRMTVLGFVFADAFAYLTDCHAVADDLIAQLTGVPVLAIDALRYRPHPTHLTIDQALAIIERIQPQRAWLTHLCHEVDHGPAEAALPERVRIAYDGLTLEIPRAHRGELHG